MKRGKGRTRRRKRAAMVLNQEIACVPPGEKFGCRGKTSSGSIVLRESESGKKTAGSEVH